MRRGGKSLAAGSDGCVFDGTFAEDGTFTKSAEKVTKVYTPQSAPVAQSEWDAMRLVQDATGGEGVVVAEGPPQAIATVPESAFEAGGNTKSACKTLLDITTSGAPHGKLSSLVLPRISGTLSELYVANRQANKRFSLPDESFGPIRSAVERMGAAGIVHMDFASRNIFYKKTDDGRITLLLGDFGNTFKIGDDFDARIKNFVDRYKLLGDGAFRLGVMNSDAIHPIAVAILTVYGALLAGEEVYTKFLDTEVREYAIHPEFLTSESWVIRQMGFLKVDASAFETAFTEKLRSVLGVFAGPGRGYAQAKASLPGIKSLLQRTLKMSDKCLLELMALRYGAGAITPERVQTLADTWFPPPKPNGGKKRGKKTRKGKKKSRLTRRR